MVMSQKNEKQEDWRCGHRSRLRLSEPRHGQQPLAGCETHIGGEAGLVGAMHRHETGVRRRILLRRHQGPIQLLLLLGAHGGSQLGEVALFLLAHVLLQRSKRQWWGNGGAVSVLASEN